MAEEDNHEALAAFRTEATFSNRFYVHVHSGNVRISFGEVVTPQETNFYTSVIMSIEGAEALVQLITRLIQQNLAKQSQSPAPPPGG